MTQVEAVEHAHDDEHGLGRVVELLETRDDPHGQTASTVAARRT